MVSEVRKSVVLVLSPFLIIAQCHSILRPDLNLLSAEFQHIPHVRTFR